MTIILDLAYLLGLLVLSPWFVWRAGRGRLDRRILWQRLTGAVPVRRGSRPCAWFHGVSVGEIHLLRQVVACFRRRHPDWDCVVSTTTDTGLAEARKHFADLAVFSWPLDFSWSVQQTLHRLRPNLVVLAESELWPGFLAAAQARGIPVAVINARLSPRSFAHYARLGFLTRRMLRQVSLFIAQTEDYAVLLRRLGVAAERLHVSGSVKYDGVNTDRANPRTAQLRQLLAVSADDLVWVAGSTQAPEEQIVVDIYRRLLPTCPRLRLFLVPRQQDRFAEVADLLQRSGLPFVRRSSLGTDRRDQPGGSLVVLVDTIGELGALWGLSDVAYVGGSLDGRRGGQNMIEPAAYGAAVLFGPHVWNFRDTVTRLLQAGAAVQITDAASLEAAVRLLLKDAAERSRLGSSARRFVLQQQGATERTIKLLEPLLTSGRQQQAA